MTLRRPTAAHIKAQADVVFCVDATTSMEPFINGVLKGLQRFADGLQSAATLDCRFRLIAYRDLHDPTCIYPFEFFDFTTDLEVFRSWLSKIEAKCGQKYRGAESALDALYYAIHSDWRQNRAHKMVVLITDDCTHPTLHPSTYGGPDGDIRRVMQDFLEMRHAMLFMVAPRCSGYTELEGAMEAAERKILAHWIGVADDDDEHCRAAAKLDWIALMGLLGDLVSQSAVGAQTRHP